MKCSFCPSTGHTWTVPEGRICFACLISQRNAFAGRIAGLERQGEAMAAENAELREALLALKDEGALREERDEARDIARVQFRALRIIQKATSQPDNPHTEALLARCSWLRGRP